MIELNKQSAPEITEEDMHAMSASQLRGLLHLCNAQLSAMRAAPVYLSWVQLRFRCITETIQRSEQDTVHSVLDADDAIITKRYTPGFIRTQERNDLGSLLHTWLDESAPFEKEALYDMLTNAQKQIQRIKLDIRGSID